MVKFSEGTKLRRKPRKTLKDYSKKDQKVCLEFSIEFDCGDIESTSVYIYNLQIARAIVDQDIRKRTRTLSQSAVQKDEVSKNKKLIAVAL